MLTLLVTADNGLYTGAKSSALYNPETKSFLYQKNANARFDFLRSSALCSLVELSAFILKNC